MLLGRHMYLKVSVMWLGDVISTDKRKKCNNNSSALK